MDIDFVVCTVQDKTTGTVYHSDGESVRIGLGHTCAAMFTIRNISTLTFKVRLLVEVYNPLNHVITRSWAPSETTFYTLAPGVQAASKPSGDFLLDSSGLYIVREYVEYEDLSCDEILFDIFSMATYTLTVSTSSGGTVTKPGTGTFTCLESDIVDLVAKPSSGYKFVGWTGNGAIANPNAASTIITMYGNYSIAANFEKLPVENYSLTLAVHGNGSTSPSVGQHTYEAGTVVPIRATPSSGYRFVEWTGDVDTVDNVNDSTTTITMNGDYSITANLEQIPTPPPGQFALIISCLGGGSVTSPGEGTFTYEAGTPVSLVASPLTGYHFVNWSGDVSTISNVNAASTKITMYDSYSIRANFESDIEPPTPVPTRASQWVKVGVVAALAIAILVVAKEKQGKSKSGRHV
jgi:hypothetical protein